jgi:hypothetical protein
MVDSFEQRFRFENYKCHCQGCVKRHRLLLVAVWGDFSRGRSDVPTEDGTATSALKTQGGLRSRWQVYTAADEYNRSLSSARKGNLSLTLAVCRWLRTSAGQIQSANQFDDKMITMLTRSCVIASNQPPIFEFVDWTSTQCPFFYCTQNRSGTSKFRLYTKLSLFSFWASS